jgi:pyruvate formate lyase activating enzyme
MNKLVCNLCPHRCDLKENQIGICSARSNINGKIVPVNYGQLTSIALDPIEKKPLRRFCPGKYILSVGSFGCNLKCQFCQNYQISMCFKEALRLQYVEPEELIKAGSDLIQRGNIGIAYTYNEPLVGYEYVRDCAILARKNNLKNVIVTNGYFCGEPMKELFPFIDALNIDLKGFTSAFYEKVGGNLETVKDFIKIASKYSHVEITTLIIPGENDDEDEIRKMVEFIASINPDIPLHLSRFFPCYKMKDKSPTEVADIYHLANVAREKLNYVYEGNC